jgi:hypothetical protein
MAQTTDYAPLPNPTAPPDYRRRVRSHLRHPLENLCLVLAILGTLVLWGFAGYEVVSAAIDQRQQEH